MNQLLSELRAVAPQRRLTRLECNFVAERQALKFLQLVGVGEAPVPTEAIAELPFLRVVHRSPLPSSGATKWIKPRWVVLLNSSEPLLRRRFSLGHELKHIIDHKNAALLYGARSQAEVQQRIERICDYFAGCLLMPRGWVRDAFVHGIQNVAELAELFDVSQPAMQVRLLQLGLLDPIERCDRGTNYWRAPALQFEEGVAT